MSTPDVVIYCLVLPAFAEACRDVRDHYAAADPRVEVIVDRRHGEIDPPAAADRRRVPIPRALPGPPGELAARSGPLRFEQHFVAVAAGAGGHAEDAVVAAVRARVYGAASELYWRAYERIHSRLSFVLGEPDEVDGAVTLAFGRVLDALEYGDPGTAFDAVLYAQIDAAAAHVIGRRDVEQLPEGGLGLYDPGLDEPVAVSGPDPQHDNRGRNERGRLLRLLGPHIVTVEHVGATAVPDAGGRDIIDLLVTVADWPADDRLVAALVDAGYEDCGTAGAPGRRYLRRRSGGDHDVHIVAHAGALHRDALALRDYLRRNPREVDRYNQVRRDAARIAPGSSMRYFDLRRLALEELLEGARLGPLVAA